MRALPRPARAGRGSGLVRLELVCDALERGGHASADVSQHEDGCDRHERQDQGVLDHRLPLLALLKRVEALDELHLELEHVLVTSFERSSAPAAAREHSSWRTVPPCWPT